MAQGEHFFQYGTQCDAKPWPSQKNSFGQSILVKIKTKFVKITRSFLKETKKMPLIMPLIICFELPKNH
jgi:hypothetical protein